jgi:hypothetical protein
MVSNFESIALSVIQGKNIKPTSFLRERIRSMEKKLDAGQAKTSEAMSFLRSEFKYNLSNDDYRRIEKELGYNGIK